MIANVAIAIAAGAASALMYALGARAPLSLVLSCLAPLPLMVAALGWGPLSAAIGGVAAASFFALLLGMPAAILYAISIGLPAWWLGHLALLGRAVPNATSAGNGAAPPASIVEWYPPGRLLLWIAIIVTGLAFVSLLTISFDGDAITGAFRRSFLLAVRIFAERGIAIDEGMADKMAAIAPAAAAPIPLVILTINLWLAGKIALTSGRLNRPWPDLNTTALPPMTLVALCVALAFCFTGGIVAIFAKVLAGALLMAYALTGLAVLHTLTSGSVNRVMWLVISYGSIVMLIGWPLLIAALLGAADALFGFRDRFTRTRPPPLPAA